MTLKDRLIIMELEDKIEQYRKWLKARHRYNQMKGSVFTAQESYVMQEKFIEVFGSSNKVEVFEK